MSTGTKSKAKNRGIWAGDDRFTTKEKKKTSLFPLWKRREWGVGFIKHHQMRTIATIVGGVIEINIVMRPSRRLKRLRNLFPTNKEFTIANHAVPGIPPRF